MHVTTLMLKARGLFWLVRICLVEYSYLCGKHVCTVLVLCRLKMWFKTKANFSLEIKRNKIYLCCLVLRTRISAQHVCLLEAISLLPATQCLSEQLESWPQITPICSHYNRADLAWPDVLAPCHTGNKWLDLRQW